MGDPTGSYIIHAVADAAVGELLAALQARGVALQVAGNQLHYKAPAGALTPALKGALARHKAQVVALLQARGQPDSAAAPAREINCVTAVPPPLLPPASTTQPAADNCAALRQVLETTGHFTPAPPDPLWADPRPDLTADHDCWQALLAAAYRHDGQDPYGVYGALNGIRCCGAQLEVAAAANEAPQAAGARPGWRLVRGDELTEAEYQRLRATYLVRHTEALTRLLKAQAVGPARQAG